MVNCVYPIAVLDELSRRIDEPKFSAGIFAVSRGEAVINTGDLRVYLWRENLEGLLEAYRNSDCTSYSHRYPTWSGAFVTIGFSRDSGVFFVRTD